MAHAGQLSLCLSLLLCCALWCSVSGHHESAFAESDLQLQAAAPSTDVFAKAIKTVMESMVKEFKEKAPKAVQKALCDHLKSNIQNLVSQKKLRATGDGVYREVIKGTVSVADILCTPNNQLLKKIPVLEVTLKCTPLYIAVKSLPFGGSFTIIPNVLQVTQLSVTMVLPQTLKPSILFTGIVEIAKESIQVQIMYTFSKDGEFEVLANTRLDGVKLKEEVQRLTSLPIPLLSSVGFLDKKKLKVKMTGIFTKNLDGDMIIEVQLKSGNRIFAILQRENGKTKTAIAADIKNIRLSNYVRSVTRQDISTVPFLGTLMLPEIGLTVSKKTIVSELVSEQFKNTRLLKYFSGNIPSDPTAFIRINSMKIIMKVTYGDDEMSLKVTEGDLTVQKFLEKMRVNVGNIPLPKSLANIWGTRLAVISYKFKERVTSVTFELKNTLQFFGGVIQVRNPTVSLQIKQPKSKVTMEANGYVTIAGTKFSVLIAKGGDGKYYLDAFAKKISFGPLLTSFRTSVLPPQLKSLARSLPFFNFGVKDFRIISHFSSKQVYLSGKPVIAGYSAVKISAVIIQLKPNDIVTVLEIDLGRSNLARLLGQLAPRAAGTLRHIAILNQNIRLRIIISPKGVKGVKLSKEIAQVFDVHRGITVRAEFKIPSNCGKDIFCKVVQRLLPGNTKLSIDASIVSTTHFRLLAGISGNIKIPGGLILKQAGLEIKVAGGLTNIGIVGKIALRNPRLDLTARIYQSMSGVSLEMIAAGCWNNAFGLPILDICNIHAAVAFGPGVGGITEIAFGAKINFGFKRCRPLSAIGYVGINSVNPNQNYYYVKYPRGMSLSVLLQALCINTRIIPAPIANSGLMPGFLYSFSATGKSIPEIRLHIPAGLQLNGRINILGFVVSANIKVTPSRGIYVAISLPPLNVARGLLKIYRSPSDRSHGPFLKADLRPPTIKVQACGYMSVLGMSASSCLKITRNELMFTIKGPILHIMRGSLTIYTRNGGSLNKRHFQAKGTINPGEFHRLVNPVRNAVSRVANVAGNAVRKATKFISQRLNGFNIANSVLNRARNALRSVQGRLNSAANRLNSLRHRVNSVCHIQRCGSKCIIPRCGCHRRGWRVRCGCSGCRRSITDPICYGRNKICQGLKAVANRALTAGKHLLNGLNHALGRARGVFHHATNGVNAARNAWNHARGQLNNVKNRFKNGIRMISQVARGWSNVFSIEQISVNAHLTNAAHGQFHASLRVIILGNRRHFAFRINLRNIVQSIIRPLAAHLRVGGLIGRK